MYLTMPAIGHHYLAAPVQSTNSLQLDQTVKATKAAKKMFRPRLEYVDSPSGKLRHERRALRKVLIMRIYGHTTK